MLVLQTPSSYNSGPNYASAEATGSGGQGSWVNPAYAEGSPNAQFATWAVPLMAVAYDASAGSAAGTGTHTNAGLRSWSPR